MLVLSRRLDERIMVGGLDGNPPIVITVVGIGDGKVRIGLDAPKEIPLHREEIFQQILREKRAEKSGDGSN